MKKILVTGGTVFVSRYIAEYYVAKNYDVYVLNRNTRKQSNGVKLIQADRYNLGEILKNMDFDLVIIINIYFTLISKFLGKNTCVLSSFELIGSTLYCI